MKPDRVGARGRRESRASASEVMPQILTNRSVAHRAADRVPDQLARARRPGRPTAPASPRPGWRRSRRRPAGGRRRRPGCPTRPPPRRRRGMRGRQRAGPLVVHVEGAQVALVDPDQAGARRPGPGRARASSCTSTSAARPSASARPANRTQLLVVEGGHDQQHGIGPHQPGVDDVGLVHGEVLAQHRAAPTPRGPPARSAGRPAEVLAVGQHRQAGRAPGHVLLGHQVGLQVRVEVALGRRPALDLGDARRAPAAQRAGEVPGRRQCCAARSTSSPRGAASSARPGPGGRRGCPPGRRA